MPVRHKACAPVAARRFTDKSLILASVALMLAAFALLSISTALPAFVAAQLAQGAARAIFWTASQTHVIRSGGSTVHRLVDFNLARNAGCPKICARATSPSRRTRTSSGDHVNAQEARVRKAWPEISRPNMSLPGRIR